VDRLDRLEFDVTFQLDGDLDHHHHHHPPNHDNNKHYSYNDNLAGIQWDVSILQRNMAAVECFKRKQL